MRSTYKIAVSLWVIISIVSCKTDSNDVIPTAAKEIVNGDKDIPRSEDEVNKTLEGIIYRGIDEIPQMKGYEHQAGAVISYPNMKGTDYKHAVAHYRSKRKNVIILEELINVKNSPKPKYKILDTVNITNLKEDEHITICSCRINGEFDPEVVAVVKSDYDEEYFKRVVQAWRMDTKSEKIIPIKNLKVIDCSNEGFGLEGCGEDIEYEGTSLEGDSIR